MIARITEDRLYIHLKYERELEEQQLLISFTRKIRNWKFKTKYSKWKGDVKFIKGRNLLPIGLWKELRDVCDRFGFELKFQGLGNIIEKDIDLDNVTAFCEKLTAHLPEVIDDFTNRPDQIDSVYKALKYRYCLLDLSTSAGKTLIMFMTAFRLFYEKKITKVLIIEPDADYVMQVFQEFVLFAAGKWDLKMCMVHGGTSVHDISENRFIIGNFQTLSNRPPEFFEGVDCLMIDEAHRGGTKSIQYIFENCPEAKYRIGLSGTIKEDKSADYYQLLAYMGPIVKTVKKRKLINQGHATDMEVKVFKLNYASVKARKFLATKKDSKKLDGEGVFRLEQQMVRESKVRLQWISNLISKLDGNTLVFFIDKKYGYGKKIVEKLKRLTTDKEIYYIDGDVKKKTRDEIKSRMEEGRNKYLVASYNTYATGKSIKNLHNIVCVESMKSEVIIGQAIGRGMRKHKSKDKFLWIDIVDDFGIFDENYNYEGYMNKHARERKKQYEEDGFKWTTHEIDLMNMSHLDLIE